jgi:hypothetical protein
MSFGRLKLNLKKYHRMKTKAFISWVLLSFFIGGCEMHKKIADESEFTQSTKGTFIKLWATLENDTLVSKELQGELIAVDSAALYMLLIDEKAEATCIAIERDKVDYFDLYYARPKTSFWTIPILTALTATHGIFFLISTPVSLLVTSLTQAYVIRSSYSESNSITIDELMPFARYPRGIPHGLSLEDIY